MGEDEPAVLISDAEPRLTPMRAIRAKCIDCMCGNKAEVRRCPCENCSLWAFRMGHRARVYNYTTEESDDEKQ